MAVLAVLAFIARTEAGLAGGFEAGAEGGEARVEVSLGEAEEGGLGGLGSGVDVVGDLVEGLLDSWVGGAHGGEC